MVTGVVVWKSRFRGSSEGKNDKIKVVHVISLLTLLAPILDEDKKLTKMFIFTFLCGATKGFMKAFKAFIKPFEAPQRSVKIKILVNFYFNTTFCNERGGKGQYV